ncbi:MAG: biotin--[acetyl-CoA-carboxylase] ligase [Candidatus Omnitrophica bacterium]|nr:biotin--[acetyl-CoA-carboxylase] ligase [Candidatus Omnitrophota bacterium]
MAFPNNDDYFSNTMKTQIIQLLKQSEGYLSGEEISRHFRISRAAIWKVIQELRKEGYVIEAVSNKGYTLNAVPDRLTSYEVQYGLKTSLMGKELLHYDTIGSTMEEAYRLAHDGAPEGMVVCAEEQTKGKGRMGRVWVSPKSKGIYMSVILRPKMTSTEAAKITLLSAVAVYEALKKCSHVDVQIKWPNDLIVQNQKLCGILTELNAEMERVRFVVVGIGLNVNTPLKMLPQHAVSLKTLTRKTYSRVEIMQEILRSLDKWYLRVMEDGFADILRQWKVACATIGKQIRIMENQTVLEGQAVDIDEYGGLIIRHQSGLITKRMTGDVIHAG